MSIEPLPGFDWHRVRWDGPHEPQRDVCSYCEATICEDEVPLRLWNDEGWAAVFCSVCMKLWWGIETYPDDDEV